MTGVQTCALPIFRGSAAGELVLCGSGAGAHPTASAVAADIDPANFCLDFKRLPLTERTKAVIPVHLYGRPCWNAEIFNDLRSRGILIIEDDAQAIGAVCSEEGFNQSRRAGNLGDAAAISFYPAKNIGAFGDAGAVATNDPRLAETVRQLANYGSLTKYHHDLCGFNCRMDEIHAALLTLKLPTLSEVTKMRENNARLYDELIQNPEVIKPRRGPDGELSAWHQYVIMHPRRDDLRRYLKEQGIDTEIHYPVPCHRQKCFMADSSFKTFGPLPEAERIAGMILSLPIADVGEEEIRYIAEVINNYGKK